MPAWSPTEQIELVKVVFWGIAALCVPLSTVYTIIAAARAKRSEQASLRNAESIQAVNNKVDETNIKIDGMLVARDAAKVKEGEENQKIIAGELASTLAKGQKEGREVVSTSAAFGADLLGKQPLPVTDERTAKAAEVTAEATARLADETGRIADVAKSSNLAKKV